MKKFLVAGATFALMAALMAASAMGQTIQVATEASGYVTVQDGKAGGPATQIVEATLKRAGLKDYRIGVYPWARAYDMARQDPNVLIYLIARTPEREPMFQWIGAVLRIEYHFYRLREHGDVVVKSLDDAKKYVVGVTRDDVRQQYLQAQGFTKLATSATNLENFRKLLSGQVQLVPLPDKDAEELCAKAPGSCAKIEKGFTLSGLAMDVCLAYSNGTPEPTVAATRKAFAQLKDDGTVAKILAEAH